MSKHYLIARRYFTLYYITQRDLSQNVLVLLKLLTIQTFILINITLRPQT